VAAWPWLYLACAVALTYVAFADPLGAIPPWVVALEFGPLAAGLALAHWRRPTAARAAVAASEVPS